MRRESAARLSVLMNAPSAVCLLLVLAYPVLYAGYLSLHEVSIRQLRTGEFPFAGAANFVKLFGDERFWLSLRHTAVFAGISVLLEVVIALAIALIVNEERVWLGRVTRLLLLVPWAVPPVVNGLLWSFIFNAQFGYLNRTLYSLGLIGHYVNWLGDPRLALGAVITAYVWRTTPFNILLYHAALQGIPADYYEAAEVDGSSGWTSFWNITLPLLRPVLAVVILFSTILTFADFNIVYVLTRGGPVNSTHLFATFAYQVGLQAGKIGEGSAIALFMFPVLAVIVYLQLHYARREI